MASSTTDFEVSSSEDEQQVSAIVKTDQNLVADKEYYFGSDVDDETLAEARQVIQKALDGHPPDESILNESDVKYKLDKAFLYWSIILNVIVVLVLAVDSLQFLAPGVFPSLMIKPMYVSLSCYLQTINLYLSVMSFIFNELNHVEPGLSKYIMIYLMTLVLYVVRMYTEKEWRSYRGYYTV